MIQVARAGTLADMELGLSVLINTARTDPLGMATSLGLNPQQVLEDLPELEEILTQGLPPFENNALLHEAAFNHTQDMLTQNYFSKISPDGRSPYDRIAETGYDSNITGETLGILAFYNFIGSETAVNILFKNMFLDELNPERTEPRNILNPEIQDMGIGIGTGVMDLGTGRYNVYLATCDFARSGPSLLELEFVNLINQAREDPLAMASSLGMDPDQILEDLPELTEILTKGIPSLSFNENLYAAASAHAQDMLKNGYYSPISLNGNSAEDRIAENGYFSPVLGETLRLLAEIDFVEPAEGAAMLFEQIFRQELSVNYAGRNILNPEFKDIGVSIAVSSPGMWEGSFGLYNSCYTLLLVADFGAGITQ